MATKGAHVFRLRIADHAHDWMRALRFQDYQPSLHTLNFDFSALDKLGSSTPPPQAFIQELGDTDPEPRAVKQLPDASWDMALKLSQEIAKSVSSSDTKMPFKFTACLEDVYVREQTPHPPQTTAVASGTRSRTASSPDANTDHPVTREKRKRNQTSSTTNVDDDASPIPGSTTKDAERPRKKGRPAIPAEDGDNSLLERDSSPIASPPDVGTPPPDDRNTDCDPNTLLEDAPLDWTRQVPQALVLNVQPGNTDSAKIGIWFLSSSMVCHFKFSKTISPYLPCFSLATSPSCPRSIARKPSARPFIKLLCRNG